MSGTLTLREWERYFVRGAGPIVSPPLKWDAARMEFFSARVRYSVAVVEWVAPAQYARPIIWTAIDDCRSESSKGARAVRNMELLSRRAFAFVEQNERCQGIEIARALGVPSALVSAITRRLAADQKIKRAGGRWVAIYG